MRAITIIALLVSINAQSQIYFKNPSLEGNPCWQQCLPINWTSCNFLTTLFNVDSLYWRAGSNYQYYPISAVEGKTFVVFEKDSSANRIELGDLSQQLDCPLSPINLYFFNFYAASFFFFDSIAMSFWNSSKGYVEVYLGHDSCDRAQLIYKTRALDTIWEKQEVYFKPNAPYQWISFWPEKDYQDYVVEMGIDSFSPIFLLNAHAVEIAQADTVLEQSGQVYIEATPNIGSINSVFWIRVHNGGIDTVARQTYRYTATQSGTYIIAARDSVVGCAGVEWSFDTVRVSMPTGLEDIDKKQEVSFSIYPNPAQRSIQIEMHLDKRYIRETASLTLYDMLGRAVYSTTFYNEQDIELPPLPEAMYTAEVQLDTHYWRGKLWVRE